MPVPQTEGSEQPRGGLREAQRRFTRQHILDAAIDVFLERGYIPSTVEDIIERAGTSRRTFYAHFRSKADVLVEAGASLLPEIQDHYRELDEALLDGSREALRDWFAARLEWRARHGALISVWEQAAAVEPAQQAESHQRIEGFPDCMPSYLARWPKDRQEEARLRVVLLNLQIGGYFNHSPPGEMDAAARALAADALTTIWYRALQPSPSAS
jgi:AcrR family transcriptional regulator